MTLETGAEVWALVDLITEDGSIVPIGSLGNIVGWQDQDPIVTFEEGTVVAHRWEIRARDAKRSWGTR